MHNKELPLFFSLCAFAEPTMTVNSKEAKLNTQKPLWLYTQKIKKKKTLFFSPLFTLRNFVNLLRVLFFSSQPSSGQNSREDFLAVHRESMEGQNWNIKKIKCWLLSLCLNISRFYFIFAKALRFHMRPKIEDVLFHLSRVVFS